MAVTESALRAIAMGGVICAVGVLGVARTVRAADLSIEAVGGCNTDDLGTIDVNIDNTGINKSSGFTPAGGGTLQNAADASCETSFDWLQIVTAQPAYEEPIFGPTPHVDPSLMRNGHPNPRSNGQPWYFFGKSLPLPTATFLSFHDHPTLLVGQSISFENYLVSFYPGSEYDVLGGYAWKDTRNPSGPNTITLTEISGFSDADKELVSSYGTTGWRYHDSPTEGVPEPLAWWLMTLGFAGVGAASRAKARSEKWTPVFGPNAR